ncbi:ER membrane glycoprotein subunit of the GPI transamidase complex-like protein [Orbilia ellipsospora]|uniref:GPI mannosyltransferase 2 n=1 Tax=Orbilia ellipsospora TaxID=2528407 RepID=A0AAV9WWR9_9PEZI
MSMLLAPLDHPVKSLSIIYTIRTLSLLLLACYTTYLFPPFSPLGYDTSSTHITEAGEYTPISKGSFLNAPFITDLVERLATALTRWDAIYFASIARFGHRWEQEWAFGVGQSYLLQGYQSIYSLTSNVEVAPQFQILFFSFCSCASHLASAILLYHFSVLVLGTAQPVGPGTERESIPRFVAFVAAALHVLSPAGIFLIAPYNEPIFSLLSFLGYWLYGYAIRNATDDGHYLIGSPQNGLVMSPEANLEVLKKVQTDAEDLLLAVDLKKPEYAKEREEAQNALNQINTKVEQLSSQLNLFYSRKVNLKNEFALVVSGFFFGVSSLFRSNGIINGILFALDALRYIRELSVGVNVYPNLRLLIATGIGGLLVGLPTLWRQYQGWLEYCTISTPIKREWCAKSIPSIYSFVQSHYWGVGFLKYWTPGNIPLFLLAAPMLGILIKTSFDIVTILTPEPHRPLYALRLYRTNRNLLFRLAVPQLVLAILAITNYHVQIITRLSSGLPIWYLVMAAALAERSSEQSKDVVSEKSPNWSRMMLRFFLGYQVVQAVLYGGFLPPA